MRYRVCVDLGWHEAESPAQAVLAATSQKYQPEQMGYIAASEDKIIEAQAKHIRCTSHECITHSKEEMWSAHEHLEWWER